MPSVVIDGMDARAVRDGLKPIVETVRTLRRSPTGWKSARTVTAAIR